MRPWGIGGSARNLNVPGEASEVILILGNLGYAQNATSSEEQLRQAQHDLDPSENRSATNLSALISAWHGGPNTQSVRPWHLNDWVTDKLLQEGTFC